MCVCVFGVSNQYFWLLLMLCEKEEEEEKVRLNTMRCYIFMFIDNNESRFCFILVPKCEKGNKKKTRHER